MAAEDKDPTGADSEGSPGVYDIALTSLSAVLHASPNRSNEIYTVAFVAVTRMAEP